MRYNILAAMAVASAAFAAPAHAEDWSAHLVACAAAAEAQGIVTGDYETKFVSASGGSVKRLALEFLPAAGEPIKAECKVKRGAVKELTIKV